MVAACISSKEFDAAVVEKIGSNEGQNFGNIAHGTPILQWHLVNKGSHRPSTIWNPVICRRILEDIEHEPVVTVVLKAMIMTGGENEHC